MRSGRRSAGTDVTFTTVAVKWVDWSNLPARVVLWVRLQRRRLWLAVLGSVFASILLLF
jgi:hypothetical protein